MSGSCSLLKSLSFLFCISVSFLIVWCQKITDTWDDIFISVKWYNLKYAWGLMFQNVPLKVDDNEDIIALYQEVWEDLVYRDSLLVAEEYANWVWANVFIKDNIKILERQWLMLSNINKKQIWFRKGWENVSAVLLEYEIAWWLISEFPLLYVSQLFVPEENSMLMLSYITENLSSRKSVSDMFKNIY